MISARIQPVADAIPNPNSIESLNIMVKIHMAEVSHGPVS